MKAVSETLPAAEKAPTFWVDAEKKVCSLEMDFSLDKNQGASFQRAIIAVNKKLTAVRVEYAA